METGALNLALALQALTFFHISYFSSSQQEKIPKPNPDETFKKFGRNAVIGFTSSVVSDTCSNSLRVIKTTKQTSSDPISYTQAIKLVTEKDGLVGLFGRGLKTRIIANG